MCRTPRANTDTIPPCSSRWVPAGGGGGGPRGEESGRGGDVRDPAERGWGIPLREHLCVVLRLVAPWGMQAAVLRLPDVCGVPGCLAPCCLRGKAGAEGGRERRCLLLLEAACPGPVFLGARGLFSPSTVAVRRREHLARQETQRVLAALKSRRQLSRGNSPFSGAWPSEGRRAWGCAGTQRDGSRLWRSAVVLNKRSLTGAGPFRKALAAALCSRWPDAFLL